MADVVYRGTPHKLFELLPQWVMHSLRSNRLLTRMGVALLSQVQQDFVTKSKGGTGRDGIKWKPLAPATIAQRRTTATERKALGITGKRERGLLTPAQNQRWRNIFGTRVRWLMAHGLSYGEAAGKAASMAWAILKREGAMTKLAVLGGRNVQILRDTGLLFRSFSPGKGETKYAGADADQQVFETAYPAVTVGTKVKYASRQHAARPFWPQAIPPEWWAAVAKAAARGIRLLVQEIATAGRLAS